MTGFVRKGFQPFGCIPSVSSFWPVIFVVCQNELTQFSAELAEFGPELTEFSLSKQKS